ncbi:MAG: hypothetical protein L0387_28680 [Acidobacteria bacterium]|nr:hypothetical protein [Acidobacteriota bacterium]MCI0720967.1 hypothetical protein [Acidobacteriota bacterium]
MRSDGFKLEIFTPGKVDVYLACSESGSIAWPLVKRLDQAGIRVVGNPLDLDPDDHRARLIMNGCSGFVTVLPYRDSESCTTSPRLLRQLRLGAELGMPLAILREEEVRLAVSQSTDALRLQFGDSDPIAVQHRQVCGPGIYAERNGDLGETLLPILDRLQADALRDKDRIRPYAFLIGRLERDFTQAREAIRAAVESEAGIPCLWSDDGRHRTNIESVRERTRLLIRHATFVIADLTLGSESPERENPSRAHEIGMAIAYDRKLMLCSQEPRRYPYFSIGDLQMTFWSTEAELECKVKEWIHAYRDSLGRSVFNHRLAHAYADYEPNIKKPCFRFDPKQRYIGPRTETRV